MSPKYTAIAMKNTACTQLLWHQQHTAGNTVPTQKGPPEQLLYTHGTHIMLGAWEGALYPK